MKIIFLDIDGVLNAKDSRSRCCGYRGVDDKRVKILAKIVEETKAEIVLTSTWKEYWQKTDKHRQGDMANYLDKKLEKYNLFIYDKTRDSENKVYFSRGESILNYLQKNPAKKFVIIDDIQFDYDGCGLTDKYVKTSMSEGLTEELAQKAIAILNGK